MLVTKLRVSKLFNVPLSELSPDVYHQYHRFVTGVIMGSGYEAKDYHRDFKHFNCRWNPNWPELYARYQESERRGHIEWACFDNAENLEFVVEKSQKVSESLPYPNKYAHGPYTASRR